MFHRFHRSHESDRCQGALTPDELERVILHIGVENILPPQEWMARLDGRRLGEHDVCLTFDDGLRSQVDVALPVLERYGLQAFWFVYSCIFDGIPVKSEIYSHVAGQIEGMSVLIDEFLRRCPAAMLHRLDSHEFRSFAKGMHDEYPFYSANDVKYRFLRGLPECRAAFEEVMDRLVADHGFNPDELIRRVWVTDIDLRALSERGHCVGLHSHTHPYELGRLTREEQRQQYEQNCAYLRSITGRRPIAMAHPLNSYSAVSLSVLTQLGIRCGFRSNLLPPASHGVNPTRLELAREDAVTIVSELNEKKSLARAV